MDIEEYRSQVETLLLQAVAEGKTKLTESEVLTMLADFSDKAAAFFCDNSVQEVHLRRSHESCNE